MKLVIACPASPHLRLLGRFELSGGNWPLRVVQPCGERLLAYLAARRDPVSRPEAAAALWPDCPDAPAASNPPSVLWRLLITTREWFRQARVHVSRPIPGNDQWRLT